MEEIRIKTKEMLDQVEKAPDGNFLAGVRSFIKFAQQQSEPFSGILVKELEAQYQAFKVGENFTGAAEYALPALRQLEITPSDDKKKIVRYAKWAIEQLESRTPNRD